MIINHKTFFIVLLETEGLRTMKKTAVWGIIAVLLAINVFLVRRNSLIGFQEAVSQSLPKKLSQSFHERSQGFRMANCDKSAGDDKARIRRDWEEAFGFDFWSPYYKYKEIERSVKDRLGVRVFRLKGEPILEKNQILYVFKSRF